MSNRGVAIEFLRGFCAGEIDGLAPLLADDLRFAGPFYRFRSREAYMRSLREDPPARCGYRIRSVTESEDQVAIFYDYQKLDGTVIVAQSFTFASHLIAEMLVVFDTGGSVPRDETGPREG